MRSLLFVPGDSERKLEKSLTSGADVLLIDLEDSVALEAKSKAEPHPRLSGDRHRDALARGSTLSNRRRCAARS